MAIQCDLADIYHNLSEGSNGTTLLNQTLYVTSSGGPVQDGIYCDGTYIYTVQGGSGVVTLVETVASLGCGGAPATPEPATPTPIPWICVNLTVHVSDNDLSGGSDDGMVYFDFYDCSETAQTISYSTHGIKNTGYCLYTKYEYSAYILVGGNKMAVMDSYIDDPYTSTICVP